MTVAEQEVTPLGGEVDTAVLEDAAAWEAYGAAVRRGAPDEVRRSFFDRAMRTLLCLSEKLGERAWPLRSSEWRRS